MSSQQNKKIVKKIAGKRNLKKKNKLIIQLNADLFGNILKEKRILFSFKYLYSKFFKNIFRKRINIFKRVEFYKRNYIPKPKKSFNAVKFRQKLIIRRFYKNLKFKQLSKIIQQNFYNIDRIFTIIESRLDMILYRSLVVFSLDEIRQMINHKHILINNKVVSYMNYNVKVGDIISFNSKFSYFYLKFLNKAINKRRFYYFFRNVKYIESDFQFLRFQLIDIPKYKNLPFFFKFNLNSFFDF